MCLLQLRLHLFPQANDNYIFSPILPSLDSSSSQSSNCSLKPDHMWSRIQNANFVCLPFFPCLQLPVALGLSERHNSTQLSLYPTADSSSLPCQAGINKWSPFPESLCWVLGSRNTLPWSLLCLQGLEQAASSSFSVAFSEPMKLLSLLGTHHSVCQLLYGTAFLFP